MLVPLSRPEVGGPRRANILLKSMEKSVNSQKQILNSVFLLLAGTCCFWTLCVYLSNYFGKPPPASVAAEAPAERGNMSKGIEPPPLPEALKPLEKATLDHPENIDALNSYADALVSSAINSGDPSLLMRAVQSYSKVIERDPKNEKALLGIATVAFENGVFDKAKDYYEKYLQINPSDKKATTDYTLSLIQAGEGKKAETILRKMAEEDPKSFPARLSLALAQKVNGNKADAKISAEAALKIAPDKQGEQVVRDFLLNLDKAEPVMTAAQDLSPAMTIDSFFRKHPIIGPKVKKIAWPSQDVVEVTLEEFPIEQMPEFALVKLKKSMADLVTQSKMKITIRFVAAETNKVILEEKYL